MSGKLGLDGAMIPRSVKRVFDERSEPRQAPASPTAVAGHRGRNHVVRILNWSESGAMLAFPVVPHIGESITLQMHDLGQVEAQVRWARDGRIGVSFANRLESWR